MEQYTPEQVQQATAYYEAAKTCKEQGVATTDCAATAATAYLVPSAAGCATGDASECARFAVTQAATAVCAAYTAGVGTVACGWAANAVIGEVWPYAEAAIDYAGKIGSNVGVALLDAFGLKDAPEFEEVANPTMASARQSFQKIHADWVNNIEKSILKMRADIGLVNPLDIAIPALRGKYTIVDPTGSVLGDEFKGKPLRIRDAAIIWFHWGWDKGRCTNPNPYREAMTDGSGSWLEYGPCFGAQAWDLNKLITDRTGKFKWAAGQLANGISRDMQAADELFKVGTLKLVELELRQPATRLALELPRGLPAKFASGTKVKRELNASLAKVKRIPQPAAKPAAKPAALANLDRKKLLLAGGLAAVTAGVVFALASS